MSKKQAYVHPCLKVREMQARKMFAVSFVAGSNNSEPPTDGTEEFNVHSTGGWF